MGTKFSFNPRSLGEFIGKRQAIKPIEIGIKAFRNTGKPLDHILLYGPPGVGKTSLSMAIANEMNVEIKIVQGSSIQNIADMISVLSTIRKSEILFIDEIHSLKAEIAEVLYPALENKVLDLIIGKNLKKKSVRIPFPECTVIAATTRLGNMDKALEDRFGYVVYLDEYSPEELSKILSNLAARMEISLEEGDFGKIIEASRGIPRNAVKILKRIQDYKLANVKEDVETIIGECGLIYKGLSFMDVKYLRTLYNYGSASIKSISQKMNLDEQTIVNKIEPYLFLSDLIVKSSRGRELTEKGARLARSLINELE